MKRKVIMILTVALLAGLMLSLSACGGSAPSGEALSGPVEDAVHEDNSGSRTETDGLQASGPDVMAAPAAGSILI